MRWGPFPLIAAVAIVVGACGSKQANVSLVTHSPSATSTPTATISSAVQASSAPSAAPVAQVMTCKLPVVLDSEAGWISFPGGTYQRDPRAEKLPPGSDAPLSKAYDKAYELWVPVARDLVSPDGQHYAYVAGAGASIHVRDMRTGVDHAFSPASPVPDTTWVAIDYESEGVYLAAQPNGPAAPVGIWLLNPSSGALRAIDSSHPWQYISAGAAWGTSEALTGHGPGPGSRLLRMDLRTGAIASWYKRTDVEFTVAGADAAGHPVLEVSKATAPNLIVVSAQNTASSLAVAAGSSVPSLSNVVHPVSDTHGMWFGDTAAGNVSLYTPGTGLKKLAHVGSNEVAIAGGCH